MNSKKQGRTLGNTVQDLLDSKRLELSIDLYKRGNKSALKAILIELGKECLTVAKNATVREAGRNWSLPYYHAKPVLLRKLSAMDGFKASIEKAHQKKWVVYCEPSMAGAEHVIRYLGQYTHRIAISNQRILNVDSTHVTFVAKDYRDRAQKKPVSLTGEEFLRRFSLHVMPDGYVRIRRFGIYHHSTKLHLDLQFVPDEKPDIEQMAADQNDETASERILRLTGFDLTKCPHCKEGRLIVIRTLPRIRSPAANLPSMLFAKLQ